MSGIIFQQGRDGWRMPESAGFAAPPIVLRMVVAKSALTFSFMLP